MTQQDLPNVDPHAAEPLLEGEEQAPPGVHAMAIARWLIVALMALAALGSILYYFNKLPGTAAARQAQRYHCPMHPSVVQDQPGDCPICGMSLVPIEDDSKGKSAAPDHAHGSTGDPGAASKVPYACPLHPDQTSSDPNAECPVCGSKLEPRKAAKAAPGGEHAGHGPPAAPGGHAVSGLTAVELPEGRIQLIGMKTARVTREALTPEIRTVGYVAVSERGQATVNTRFAGWIEKLHVNQTGERIGRGQVLATIYSPQLLAAQQDYLNARRWASSGSGEGLEEAARHRLELLGISPKDLAELVKTGQALRALPLRSPVSGHVTVKNALPGLYVQPGTQLFEVADLSTVWVLADVYEYEAGRVRVGQEARFELAALPGEPFTGKVRFVYPSLEATTRTLRLRLELKNSPSIAERPKDASRADSGLRLKPGMYGTVKLQLARSDGLVIPEAAVIDTGEAQYAFIAKPGGRFEPRSLQLGTHTEGKVQVLAGLAEGETVVTTGNFLIDSESRLRAAIEAMPARGEPPPSGGAGGHSGHGQ